MLELKDILNITPLLFILNITILTNFIGDTLSHKIQKMFNDNMLLKHLIVILLIYTTITVIDKSMSPLNRFKKSIYIWILFVLLTKNTLRMTTILVVMMIVLYIIEDYIDYYKNTNKKLKNNLEYISKLLKYVILILLVVGHIMYVNKQKNVFGTNFNYYKLYLGNKL